MSSSLTIPPWTSVLFITSNHVFFFKLKCPATGVSGQPGANVRVDVEDIRAGRGFVTTRHPVMEAQTVVGNFSKLMRETALNVLKVLFSLL